jgi:hypothetical protein
MASVLLAVIIGIPLAWHLAMAAYVSYDSRRHPLDTRKWTAIALLVPLFGFFAYLFERHELDYDPESDPYAEGAYNFERDPDEETP